jgi:hypothetical protein
MQRVMCMPELLDLVFNMLDRSSNAKMARVCKKWSSVALDMLWREVDDLHQLFSLLAPLRKTGGIGYVRDLSLVSILSDCRNICSSLKLFQMRSVGKDSKTTVYVSGV